MNKLLISFCLLCLSLSSCKTDVDLLAPYKEVMVIYGVLDPTDSVQYIRINKAFLGEGNAYTFAQVADSFQYADVLDVKLERYKNNNFAGAINLERFEGPPLKDGIFASAPNYLYRTTGLDSIYQDSEYKLVVTNTQTGNVVTSKTAVVSKAGSIINPNPSSLYGYVNFADPANPFVTKFSSSDKAKYYDLNIKFNYKEIEIANPSNFEMKSIFFRVDGVEKQSNNSLEIPVSYTTFYSALRRLIPVNPFVKREAEPLDFVLVGGAEELYTYYQVNRPPTGINQSIPQYTNIEGGIGIFSSKYTDIVSHKSLSQTSMDSLINGAITKDLGFQ
ncbi:MAG: DUF4249 family protein [Bacteroidetes bacterium]|nr:DUF4249 family protein [Bacteroidota bacterium]HMW10743.1 hypothetical protein [Bacteroidia bacterium]HNB13252.1 hypothetical protein [Bacteroidia bacterium]HNF32568.1 hypothetical protein [Bacteroidia bacterium]HNJ31477.1 hypothetical protein [Bacteroidia bacterium]